MDATLEPAHHDLSDLTLQDVLGINPTRTSRLDPLASLLIALGWRRAEQCNSARSSSHGPARLVDRRSHRDARAPRFGSSFTLVARVA